ncbi:MAG: hypothetical protein ACI9DC_000525 [Gammaproteobacteria bacterium]|jgi:hypothetical protein
MRANTALAIALAIALAMGSVAALRAVLFG